MNTVLPRIVAQTIINFEGNFARKYFVLTSRSVIGIMHYFDVRPLLMRNLFQLQKYSHKGRGRAVSHYHYVII